MAAIEQRTSSSHFHPSRFDRAVWTVMALLILLIALLIWQQGRQSMLVPSETAPAILFSTSDENSVEQLFMLPIEIGDDIESPVLGEVRQLTEQEGMVWDYAVRPDGEMVVYSELTEQVGTNLWQLRTTGDGSSILMACSPSACNGPSWSADGSFVGFSQRFGTEENGGVLNPPRPWMLHVESGETAALLPDDQELGFDLRWSSDGQWVAYVSPIQGQVGLVSLADGGRRFFDSGTGEPVAWHPGQPRFLYTSMISVGDVYVPHLFLAQVDTEASIDLSGVNRLVEDRNPAWSPDGEWIVVRRKIVEGAGATRGSQLWLFRADGSDVRALTADLDADHGAPQWSPDGRFLVFQKTPLKGPDLELSVWLLDVESGESWEVVRPGQRPAWIVDKMTG